MIHQPLAFQFPYAIVYWVVFWMAFGMEGRVVRVAMDQSPTDQDQGTFRFLMVATPIALAMAFLASVLPWCLIDDPLVAFVSGLALTEGGVLLRVLSKKALASSFTGRVVVVATQEVVQTGVYRFVRHPSYTAAFMMLVGITIALGSWLSAALMFVACSYIYGKRVRVEESALLETLGEPYRQYMAKTTRYIPFLI